MYRSFLVDLPPTRKLLLTGRIGGIVIHLFDFNLDWVVAMQSVPFPFEQQPIILIQNGCF
jgi:hypothetical protein